MSTIEVGQVLFLDLKEYTSNNRCLCLVVDVDESLNVVEIVRIHPLAGNEYKAIKKCNKVIYHDDPIETVIEQDSYIQMDHRMRLENCAELEKYRRQTDKLSHDKLQDVLRAYRRYQDSHDLDKEKNVYIEMGEIRFMNEKYVEKPSIVRNPWGIYARR